MKVSFLPFFINIDLTFFKNDLTESVFVCTQVNVLARVAWMSVVELFVLLTYFMIRVNLEFKIEELLYLVLNVFSFWIKAPWNVIIYIVLVLKILNVLALIMTLNFFHLEDFELTVLNNLTAFIDFKFNVQLRI